MNRASASTPVNRPDPQVCIHGRPRKYKPVCAVTPRRGDGWPAPLKTGAFNPEIRPKTDAPDDGRDSGSLEVERGRLLRRLPERLINRARRASMPFSAICLSIAALMPF